MRLARLTAFGVMLLAATIGMAANAAAQTNDEVFPEFQWNFSTPGARANGMGRTFIGVADDATATVTNPAGLVNLTKPQVYAEYKNTSIKVNRLAATDSWLSPDHHTTEFSTNVNALSFFSISTPVKNRLAVGFTYHQFLNYQETFQLDPRPVPDINNPTKIVSTGAAANPVQGSADFTGASYAGTVAYAINDKFRAGLTLSANHLDAQATATRLAINFLPGYPANPSALSSSTIVTNETVISKTGNAFGMAVGLLYRPNESFSVGFDYTKSPHFDLEEGFLFNPGFTNSPCCGTQKSLVSVAGFPTPIAVNVPDHFGFGIAARPMPKLLVAFDVVRVNYSSLSDDFTLIFDSTDPTVSPSMFTIDDATEVHFGAEYNIVTGNNPVFLRAGLYTNPDHTIQFSKTIPDNVKNSFYNATYNLLPRDTEVKGTFGGGIAIGPRYQIDLAYVWNKEFVASAAVRF